MDNGTRYSEQRRKALNTGTATNNNNNNNNNNNTTTNTKQRDVFILDSSSSSSSEDGYDALNHLHPTTFAQKNKNHNNSSVKRCSSSSNTITTIEASDREDDDVEEEGEDLVILESERQIQRGERESGSRSRNPNELEIIDEEHSDATYVEEPSIVELDGLTHGFAPAMRRTANEPIVIESADSPMVNTNTTTSRNQLVLNDDDDNDEEEEEEEEDADLVIIGTRRKRSASTPETEQSLGRRRRRVVESIDLDDDEDGRQSSTGSGAISLLSSPEGTPPVTLTEPSPRNEAAVSDEELARRLQAEEYQTLQPTDDEATLRLLYEVFQHEEGVEEDLQRRSRSPHDYPSWSIASELPLPPSLMGQTGRSVGTGSSSRGSRSRSRSRNNNNSNNNRRRRNNNTTNNNHAHLRNLAGQLLGGRNYGLAAHPANYIDDATLNRLGYEELLNLSEQIGEVKQKGLRPNVINNLPIIEYSKQATHSEDETKCTICLMDYEDGEKIKKLIPCLHVFHVGCCDTWLKTNGTCPICRTNVG